MVHGLPWSEISRQHAPGDATLEHIKNRVRNGPQIDLPLSSTCFRRRKQRFNQRPLRRRQIARIGNHPTTIPHAFSDRFLVELGAFWVQRRSDPIPGCLRPSKSCHGLRQPLRSLFNGQQPVFFTYLAIPMIVFEAPISPSRSAGSPPVFGPDMAKVNSLFVIAASIWDQWTLESSAAYLMLKSLSSGIGYHINPYRPR